MYSQKYYPDRPEPIPVDLLVSVIVVNWNKKELLGRCLNSLGRQDFSSFEIIVIDNASSDGSVEFVRTRFPGVHVEVCAHNLGFAKACNIGVRQAKSRYIALLNNDAEVNQKWLGELVDVMGSDPSIGSCASMTVMWDERKVVDACGDFYTVEGVAGKIGHREDVNGYLNPRRVFGASAGAAIYRRSMLDDIGLFDEDFFMTHEDTDLSFRAQLMGYQCQYVPTAIAYHELSATIGVDSDIHVYYGKRNIEFVFFKNMPTRLLLKYLPLHLLTELLMFPIFLRRGQGRIFLRAKLDALGSLSWVLRKRRSIQDNRRVTVAEIEDNLEKRWLSTRIRKKLTGWLQFP